MAMAKTKRSPILNGTDAFDILPPYYRKVLRKPKETSPDFYG